MFCFNLKNVKYLFSNTSRPRTQPVDSGVQNDGPVYGPNQWPVNTARKQFAEIKLSATNYRRRKRIISLHFVTQVKCSCFIISAVYSYYTLIYTLHFDKITNTVYMQTCKGQTFLHEP